MVRVKSVVIVIRKLPYAIFPLLFCFFVTRTDGCNKKHTEGFIKWAVVIYQCYFLQLLINLSRHTHFQYLFSFTIQECLWYEEITVAMFSFTCTAL